MATKAKKTPRKSTTTPRPKADAVAQARDLDGKTHPTRVVTGPSPDAKGPRRKIKPDGAPAAAGRPPGAPMHWTAAGTKKHQTNGPVAWSAVFLAAAKKAGFTREGDGVRIVLARGVAVMAKELGIEVDAAPIASHSKRPPADDPRQTSIPGAGK